MGCLRRHSVYSSYSRHDGGMQYCSSVTVVCEFIDPFEISASCTGKRFNRFLHLKANMAACCTKCIGLLYTHRQTHVTD